MTRHGFTLIEVVIAIALTGVIALIVFGTLHAGVNTSERVDEHSASAEAHIILRQLLVDALRHPVEGGGVAMNDTLFLLEDRMDANGNPTDAIAFVSRGVRTPHGATAAWRVLLATGTDGLRLRAEPTRPGTAPLELTLPAVRGLDVQVLDRTADALWLQEWPFAGRVPAAVAVRFIGRDARELPPLIVHAALEPVR